MVAEAFIGAVGGGLLRLAPEALKVLDNISQRRHELAMQEIELKFVKALGGQARGGDFGPIVSDTAFDGLREQLLAKQAQRAEKRYPWIGAVSALVRPSVTFALVGMYVCVRIFGVYKGLYAYGVDDIQLLSGILAFWFVGRVWERSK